MPPQADGKTVMRITVGCEPGSEFCEECACRQIGGRSCCNYSLGGGSTPGGRRTAACLASEVPKPTVQEWIEEQCRQDLTPLTACLMKHFPDEYERDENEGTLDVAVRLLKGFAKQSPGLGGNDAHQGG
jgi:hypothetical protein